MSGRLLLSPVLFLLAQSALAQELNSFQALYDESSVRTRTLTVHLDPVDSDGRFSVTLLDNETGFEGRHEFEAPVPEMPVPFQFEQRNICGASVVLLTVDYPWRHDWPQVVRILDTYAFRGSDFAFIDVAAGALTDIALLDRSQLEAEDMAMQPPILVECISDSSGFPFRFEMKTSD
ncbi:MAG: hypothetical protein R3D84_07810 [Paracoccaceae bacterium]